jgi:hypothetical protein
MESPVFTMPQVESLGRAILKSHPNAIVRLRILRDVLQLPSGSAELVNTRSQVISHPWVKELVKEQHSDGSWGRFHSMDSTIKARFLTTEIAVRRSLALGLDNHAPILVRVVEFMKSVLAGNAAWSDREEKSEGWPMGVEAITAATLAQVDPVHPATLPAWDYWVGIASQSFPGGAYDKSAEWEAHKAKRGIGIHYLGSRYVLTLLGARSDSLPATLDRQIVDWIWNNPAGIGYLGADMQHPDAFHIFHWLESLEILSRFKSGPIILAGALTWLWNQHNRDEMWDFGAKVSKSIDFPLSDDWRRQGNRSLDHSTRVLACLSAYDPGI